jgi:hypothetical protein
MTPDINHEWCKACDGKGFILQVGAARICVVCKGQKIVSKTRKTRPYPSISKRTVEVLKERQAAREPLFVDEDKVFDKKHREWKLTKGQHGLSFDEFLRLER